MQQDKTALVKAIMDALFRSAAHYGLWYAESVHQVGFETALNMERDASARFRDILLRRLSKTLGFTLEEGLPQPLLNMEQEQLESLLQAVSMNWLALDGVWFQAAEAHAPAGMHDAKRINDTCWNRFSPLEASHIREILQFTPPASPQEALSQLETALAHRLYARINVQEVVERTQDSFVFRMKECRVQVARKRKGLEDYPCKSGGCVEYATFASAFSPLIRTDCIACPPDPHPDDWYCAWRFSI